MAELEEDLLASKAQKAPQQEALKAELKTAQASKRELESERTDLEVRYSEYSFAFLTLTGSRHQRDKRKLKEQIIRARQEVESLTKKIHTEEEKIQQSTDGTRAALEADIAEHKAERYQIQQKMQELTVRINEIDANSQTTEQLVQQKKTEFDTKNHERGQHQGQKAQLEQRLNNKWNIYGNSIGEVIKMVDKTRWRGIKPIGPLGDYVELKQREWIIPVKIAIGSLMSSWIVEHADDRIELKRILAHFKK